MQPPEAWKPAREFKQGDLVWVRDYRPNALCKWVKGVVRSPAGTLNYEVEIEGGNWRKEHVDHLTQRWGDSTGSHMPSEIQYSYLGVLTTLPLATHQTASVQLCQEMAVFCLLITMFVWRTAQVSPRLLVTQL